MLRSRKRGLPADVITGGPCVKQLKTRPLTAADIPDIASTVVQTLPPQTGTTQQDQAAKQETGLAILQMLR